MKEENMKTNININPVGGEDFVSTKTPSSPTRVQRIVRQFLRFATDCVCVNELVVSSDLKVVNKILAKEPQCVGVSIGKEYINQGIYTEIVNYYLSRKVFILHYFAKRVYDGFNNANIFIRRSINMSSN